MLHDLRLSELPDNVLYVLQKAVDQEISSRYEKHTKYLRRHDLATNKCLDSQWFPQQPVSPFALPQHIRLLTVGNRLRYLPSVLQQDWSQCFVAADEVKPIYYVYAHIDPREQPLHLFPEVTIAGQPFYIGKGSGQRAWNLRRNEGHGKRLKALLQLGYKPSSLVCVLAERLTERQALCLEAKLIYFFGSIYDETVKGCLLNLADSIKPQFEADLYERKGAAWQSEPFTKKMRETPRWVKWQQSTIAVKYLPLEARLGGYTVLRVGPRARELFYDMAQWLILYERFAAMHDVEVIQMGQNLWKMIQEQLACFRQRLPQKAAETSEASENLFPHA